MKSFLKPKESLNKAFLKVKPIRNDIELFKTNLKTLVEQSKIDESEEHHKNNLSYFLNKTYFDGHYFINTKGRQDLVIHYGNSSASSVGVIIEAKKPSNKSEMLSLSNINTKALQELLLYFLRERISNKNLEVKNLIATNVQEWFIFDAQTFEKQFANDKKLVQKFKDFEEGKLSGSSTDFFYSEIAKPYIEKVKDNLEFTYFKLEDYSKALYNDDLKDDNQLISLYKLLSPEHLLKLPFANDSNSLDKKFYNELLHIIGLEEVKDGGKKVISRKAEVNRNYGSLLENTIYILEEGGYLSNIKNESRFGDKSERAYNVALELCITWINRILFLKLLESQLYAYNKGDEKFKFLNFKTITNYDDLNKLFFSILAKKENERHPLIKEKYAHIPYLNSSLFEQTELEQSLIVVTNLDNNIHLEIYDQTVLKDDSGKKLKGKKDTLQYLFEFLEAYDFSSEGGEEIQEENKSLINASVLGLIFEKINGYKDGSFFTPGFITMYMCKETIRRAVVQKFNETNKWSCKDYDELYNKIDDIAQANQIINSLKICDPAVGSGHFLVSALNEIIAIKHDLKILCDKNGKRLKEYQIAVINDELIVTDEDGELFEYNPRNSESQRVQETLFNEKQTIIENCLFGVDINPNSVKICRLRLWIELLKNAYYKTDPSVTERSRSADDIGTLETLPNIDINIKTGNSLISRFPIDIDIKDALKKNKNWNIESYKFAVSNYRNAKSKDEKRQLTELIDQIKSDFRSEVSGNDPKRKRLSKLMGELETLQTQTTIFERTKAEQKQWEKQVKTTSDEITKIEKYIEDIESNQIYHNAFEWRFEFPEVLDDEGNFIGFDVVIGNPPYVDFRYIDKEATILLKEWNTSESTKPNLYQFFIELGYNILGNGYLSYINPNGFLSIDSGYGLRKLLVNNTKIIFINDLSYVDVFDEASTYTVVWLFKKEVDDNYDIIMTKNKNLYELGLNEFKVNINDILSNSKNMILPNKNLNIIYKIEKEKIRIKDIANLVWGTSQSGYGKKKILKDKYLQLNNIEKDLYSPIIQTRDIKRFYIDWKKEYIPKEIFTNNVIEIFNKKIKIVIARVTLRLQSSIDINNNYVGKSSILFDLDNNFRYEFIMSILNSKLIDFWYKNYFENTHMAGGYIRFDIPYIKEIPIPNISNNDQQPIINLVDKILEAKNENPEADTSHWEAEIDQLVYKLYDLTPEEIKIVEEG